MIHVGVDPNWQQDKLNRLFEALQLAKARREQRRQGKEQQATKQLQLILSATEKNPRALESETVRRFVDKNKVHLPGLQEWYELETTALRDPTNPRNAYEKLLAGADAATQLPQAVSSTSLPGPGGAAMRFAGKAAQAAIKAEPAKAFDIAQAELSPSERVRAGQFAQQNGAEIPLSDPQETQKKVSGPLYVLSNPQSYPPEVVRAARIQLQLENPKVDPAEKVSGALYVVEHPEEFQADTVTAARAQLELQLAPTEKPRTAADRLSGAMSVLNDPGSYSPEVVRYARSIARQAEREGRGDSGSSSRGESEKGRLTEYQAVQSVDDFLGDFYERFQNVGGRRLTPGQRRQAANLMRSGQDVDSFVVNSMFPGEEALGRIVAWRLRQKDLQDQMKARAESPKARAARTRTDALREIERRQKAGMSREAARASVYLDILEGL